MEPHRRGKDFWGPAQWTALHSYAATYETKMRNSFIRYVYSMIDLLPCISCRQHMLRNVEVFPIEKYLKDNHSVFLWTYLLHNLVNQDIGVPSPPYHLTKKYFFWHNFVPYRND